VRIRRPADGGDDGGVVDDGFAPDRALWVAIKRFARSLGSSIWDPHADRRDLFGSTPPTPFGIGDDLWQFFLSLPVVFYSSWIFFRGTYVALRA
jgi:P-type Cu2+ transporter